MKIKNIFLACTFFLFAGEMVQAQTNLWAVTTKGGNNNNGALVKMNMDGTGFTKVYDFIDSIGSTPVGNLVQAPNGLLYGNCETGGQTGSCVLYSYNPATNTYTDLFDYGANTGDDPTSGMVLGTDGLLYGVASGGGTGDGVIYSFNPVTNVYTELFSLAGNTGSEPFGAIMFGTDGKLYGMTITGGNGEAGAIYSYDIPSGTYKDLYDFNGDSSGAPDGTLIQLNDGLLYGVTSGDNWNIDSLGYTQFHPGNIFSFNPVTNTYTNLYDFDSITGEGPLGTLIYANGKLYGTAEMGGANNSGVIFSFDLDSKTYSDLFDFDSIHGANPSGDLALSTDGNLYGTTSLGGSSNLGVVFRFNPVSNAFTKLVDFDSNNGASPGSGGFIIATVKSVAAAVANPSNNNTHLSVYPIPSKQMLTVNISAANTLPASLSIIDINGQTVLTQPIGTFNKSLTETIDISDLSAGVYFIEATINNKKLLSKIVKE